MPRCRESNAARAPVIVTWAALCCLALPAPALAYTFVLTSDASGQTLTRLSEGCTSYNQASTFSSGGRIPLTTIGAASAMGGGMLDWVGSSGSLKVVAMPVARAAGSTSTACAGGWGAIDARAIPLTFQIAPEVGDPFPLFATLQIVPRLLGTTEQFTNPGCTSYLWLEYSMVVAIDGQVISSDSLWLDQYELSEGADAYTPRSFPKGGANSKVVSGVTPGSEIQVTLWAYMRGLVQGSGSIDAFSPYGDGPAIEIQVRDANAVAVADPATPQALQLAAHPNPSPGAARLSYALPRADRVRLAVYDIHGARVTTLIERVEEAGRHEFAWDGRDGRGERLAPGVYLMELAAGAERTVGKLVLLGR